MGIAFFLKHLIANRQCFIHHQEVRLNMRLNGKGQPYGHATGVHLDRLMDEITDVCKVEDGIQAFFNFVVGQS